MNYLPLLVTLSENEKRIIIILFFLIVVVLLLFGVIYDGFKKFFTDQGRDIGRLMGAQIESGFITSLSQFKKNAFRKSRITYFKEFGKTFIAMLIWFMIYGIISLIYRHWLNLFDQVDEGFMTLVYTFDFKNMPTEKFFGMNIVSDWPPVLHTPFFSAKAIPSYILAVAALILIILFIHQTLSFLARTIYILQNSKKLFTKDIAQYELTDLSAAPAELQEKGINTPTKREPKETETK